MDDGQQTTKTYEVPTHGGTMLKVVYTKEEHTLEHALGIYKEWLESAKHKIVGLDLEYTPDRRARANRHAQARPHVPLVQVITEKSWMPFAAKILFNEGDHICKCGHDGRQESS